MSSCLCNLNAFVFAYLSPDDGPCVYANAAEERQEAVETAALADVFGVAAGRHARTEVRQYAQAAVAETSTKAVLPLAFAGHSDMRRRHVARRFGSYNMVRAGVGPCALPGRPSNRQTRQCVR